MSENAAVTTVRETIPEPLRAEVDAALAWFNAQESDAFSVTGILDAETALAASAPRPLRLVLCGGDRCLQRSFLVREAADGYEVAFAEAEPAVRSDVAATPPELDPPPGALRGWLDRALVRHRFVVVLFYRGFW